MTLAEFLVILFLRVFCGKFVNRIIRRYNAPFAHSADACLVTYPTDIGTANIDCRIRLKLTHNLIIARPIVLLNLAVFALSARTVKPNTENIATGQQIEKFSVYIEQFGTWRKISKKTVIGYKKIITFKRPKKTKKIKIRIDSYRVKCTLNRVEAHKSE